MCTLWLPHDPQNTINHPPRDSRMQQNIAPALAVLLLATSRERRCGCWGVPAAALQLQLLLPKSPEGRKMVFPSFGNRALGTRPHRLCHNLPNSVRSKEEAEVKVFLA